MNRDEWLQEVGEATKPYRERRAHELERRASRRLWNDRAAGFTDLHARESARWHGQRARGYRERIQRVQDCGGTVVRVVCTECGRSHEQTRGCGDSRLCLRCRGAIASQKRARFMGARRRAVDEARGAGLLDWHRRGGRWSEKFLTLTVPHMPEHDVMKRIDLAWRAWPRFLKRSNEYVRSVGPHAHWFRVFEWTPGDDGAGHPHFHVWLLSPFLPRDEVTEWWRRALAAAGMAASAVETVIVDIREVSGSDGAARELVKYLTKDIDKNGAPFDPVAFGRVWQALDAKRVTQASRGFLGSDGEPIPCECGAVGRFRIEVAQREA